MNHIKTDQLQRDLAFARDLAREAGKISLNYFRKKFAVESKPDKSYVTVADRETELFVRERISKQYPNDAILGEEYGETNPGAPRRWIVDPIDGTYAFVHGIPLYTLLLALEIDGDSQLGIIHNAPLDETMAAATGLGCTLNGEPCRVSEESDLAAARVHTTDWARLRRMRPKFTAAVLDAAQCGLTWADAYGYLLVASGRADVMFDPIVSLWDTAALKPCIKEAGGRFTDLEGNPTIYAKHALATNGKLHDDMLALLLLDDANV